MALETDLNISPIHDDYDETKNFHRVLFRPGVPVQARELTQAQTILQNQVERFGQNIFKEGTIIKGSNFTFDQNFDYVKVLDEEVDGTTLVVGKFSNTVIKNTANLSAIIVDSAEGLESQNPDLNTFYVKYINKGINGEGIFANTDVLTAYENNYALTSVYVANSGIGYSNSDLVVFTSATGSGANASITTDVTGHVTAVTLLDGGEFYYSNTTVTVANSSGGTANGTGVILSGNNIVGQITVSGNTFSTSNTETFPTGQGYSFKVSEGIIFQKGFFIRVEPQNIVVSKYTSNVSDVVIGFETVESIVNSSIDSTLLDNSLGTPNENAPGAFRLKLVPTLVKMSVAEAGNTSNFFTLVEFQNGRPVRQKQATEYNVLGDALALRTSEESGNYVLNQFNVITNEISGNTSHFQAKIGSGTAYVNGYRVRQYDTYSVPVRKGIDTDVKQNVTVSINYGDFVLVNNVLGIPPVNINPIVSLRSAVSTGISAGAGSEIGTANIRTVAINSTGSNPIFRVYLYNIKMTTGSSFQNVRSIFYNGGGSPDNFVGDLILESGSVFVFDAGLSPYVYKLNQKAVKTLKDEDNNNENLLIYTAFDSSVSFAANGVMQKNITSPQVFPYSGVLSNTEKADFIFTTRNSANSVVYGGTVSVNTTSPIVTGTSTTFLSNFKIGDYFIYTGSTALPIISIANNTSLTLSANGSVANTSAAYYKNFPTNTLVNFQNDSNKTITITDNIMVADLGEEISGTLNISAIYNVQKPEAVQLTKNINKNSYVKLNLTTANNITGPWCLGLPDVVKIRQVLKTSNSNYTTSATDVTDQFILDNGQKDTLYDLSFISKKPSSSLTLANTDFITVIVDNYTYTNTGGGAGFFSVDSYPVDDATESLPSDKIRTYDLPIFTSATTGSSYDLRDCVDFRTVISNTAATSNTLGGATVNPSSNSTLNTSEKTTASVDSNFRTDLQYYAGRYDKVYLTSYGNFEIKEGISSDNPTVSSDSSDSMLIATMYIPPFPTLTTGAAAGNTRPNYVTKISLNQNKRYTMADIGKLDDRLSRVEYYTSLSLLESKTNDLLIPSAVDPSLNRFKNGIFVDTFADFNASNLLDVEYSASIDEALGVLRPKFKQNSLNLKVGNTDLTQSGDILTLPFDHALELSQPYATRVRNCTENYWNFMGTVELVPSYDNYYETRVNPENTLTLNIDTSASTLALMEELNAIKAINQVNTTTTSSTQTILTGSDTIDTGQGTLTTENYDVVTDTISTQTKNMLVGQTTDTISVVGDFITDVSFNPYIREQVVKFKIYGLKPNSIVYSFFDKVNVSAYTQNATYNETTSEWLQSGNIGDDLIVNDDGSLFGFFYLPASTFFVGDREFRVMDIDDMDSASSASTNASTSFSAYNFSATTSQLVTSTRSVDVSTTTVSSTTTSTTRTSTSRSTFVANQRNVDPVAQTFRITAESANSQESKFVTKLDLFFKRKDPTLGITVQLRTTENGYPSASIIPFTSIHLSSADVNISDDGSVPTTITFTAPVGLNPDTDYAFVVMPDGASPEYLIFTGQSGYADLANSALACRQDWGSGVMFTSTNNSAWQSIQDEDIKFNLYSATFTETSGSVTLVNKDNEYFTTSNVSGSFIHGESLFKYSNTSLTGNVTFQANSMTLTGNGTLFQTQLQIGSKVIISNTVSMLPSSLYDIVEVVSISSNTSAVLKSFPKFSSNGTSYLTSPSASVYFYDSNDSTLIGDDSTAANSTFKFSNNDIVVGISSGASANVVLFDQQINYFQPLIYRTTTAGTNIGASAKIATSTGTMVDLNSIKFNDTNNIKGFDGYVLSKSNNLANSSFQVDLTLTTNDVNTSPTVDLQSCSILRYNNIINNDSTNENTQLGNLVTKYITKTVTLNDQMDAEDIKVYVTGYQPVGTEIEVSAKIMNNNDSDSFKTKSWTKLQVSANTTSDTSNINDFREFEYSFGSLPSVTLLDGVVSVSTSNTITGSNTNFSANLVGKVIAISSETDYFVTKVSAVGNTTSLSTYDIVDLTGSGYSIKQFDDSKQAFRDPNDDGIVNYYNDTGKFSTYKTFAIKIGLKSTSTNVVPKCADLRAIAVTV